MLDLDDSGTNRLIMAAIAGVLAFILFIWIIDFSFFWSLVCGVIVGVIVYFLTGRLGEDAEGGGGVTTRAIGDPTSGASSGDVPSRGPGVSGTTSAMEAEGPGDDAVDTGSVGASPVTGAPVDVHGRGAGGKEGGKDTPVSGSGGSGGGPKAKPGAAPGGAGAPAAKPGKDKAAAGKAAGAKPAKPATAAKPSPAAAKPAAASEAGEDYDRDGVAEGTDEGTKPATLSGPRDSGADNLKEIKGVGPKMEKMLNEMGFYHFDQIAAWTADEVAWVDANLKGFKGRVSRDNWVEQAKILAAGGDTEFSKRVDQGKVY